ncbi:MAG: FAD-dependent oxidoreductase, partial [Armatimonadota bacterium]
MIPQDVENLFVPVCCSATHVGYCTLRMEPVYMILGHACGVAAHMARAAGVPVQSVDVAALQEALASQGQILRVNRPPVADFRIETPRPLKAGQEVRFRDASTDDRGIVRWEWDLDGNGEVDSREQNPTHTYRLGGVYRVRLRVSDGEDWSPPVEGKVVIEGEPKAAPVILMDNDAAQ